MRGNCLVVFTVLINTVLGNSPMKPEEYIKKFEDCKDGFGNQLGDGFGKPVELGTLKERFEASKAIRTAFPLVPEGVRIELMSVNTDNQRVLYQVDYCTNSL